ncbi:MAG: hypothetical protein KC493_04670 [Bacteriovoracaceae bacterium]|nr:hypothetical protein [Bacteriovoracaceae bacterium]
MLRASIDIGSNSVLLLIANVDDSELEEISDNATITGLGRNLDEEGLFTEEAMEDSLAAFKNYKGLLDKYEIEPQECLITATEASRVAKNSKEFFSNVKSEFGFEVKIISGDGEAHYTARGVTLSILDNEGSDVVIMDVGGASTELILVKSKPFKVKRSISLPVGSVRAKDWIDAGIFQEKLDEILKNNDLTPYQSESLIGAAGSMTSLGGMMKGLTSFESQKINKQKIEFDKFCEFVDKIQDIDEGDLSSQYPFLGKRSRTIGAGARVARAIGLSLKVSSLEISTFGLRHGTLFEGSIDERFISRQ